MKIKMGDGKRYGEVALHIEELFDSWIDASGMQKEKFLSILNQKEIKLEEDKDMDKYSVQIKLKDGKDTNIGLPFQIEKNNKNAMLDMILLFLYMEGQVEKKDNRDILYDFVKKRKNLKCY